MVHGLRVCSVESLDGKVAFVTGAGRARGIGRAAALELARHGADVAVTDLARPSNASMAGLSTVATDRTELDETVREMAEHAITRIETP